MKGARKVSYKRLVLRIKRELPELKGIQLSDYDCILLIPNQIGVDNRTKAVQELLRIYANVEQHQPNAANVLKLLYQSNDQILALEMKGSVQFCYPNNPIICIASNTEEKNNIIPDYSRFAPQMMFRVSSVEQANTYFQNTPVRVIGINAYEQYQKDLHHYISLMVSSGILTVLILIFHISVTAVLISLEYSLNAKEISIKKILGYSIFSKNKNLFIRSAVVFVLISVAEIIFSVLSKKVSLLIGILITVVLLVFDMMLLMFFIFRIEQKQIVKILKGGAL